MAKDLVNKNGLWFGWNNIGWCQVLALGFAYGWRPKGTQLANLDPGQGWDGSYQTNEGQIFLAGDSLNLASALERALDDIPNTNTANPEIINQQSDFKTLARDTKISFLRDRFSGDEKKNLLEFICYCRKGGFMIF